MDIILYSHPIVTKSTYAGNGGSDGLFLNVKGCAASIKFDNAGEAEEIAGAILAGLHKEIAAYHDREQRV